MSEKGGLDILGENTFTLYKEAGKEIPYTKAKFTYDSDIVMGGLKKTRVLKSVDRLGILHQPECSGLGSCSKQQPLCLHCC